jgi:6-phosphogluconolactonase
MRIETYADRRALTAAAARRFTDLARRAADRQGRFSAVLCGGDTPRELYQALAEAPDHDGIDWRRMHLFWGDERCVPPDHPRSNYGMVNDILLKRVPVPARQVHRIPGEIEPRKAARIYEAGLREYFQAGPPRFDLVLLGMGGDGHTASLFPGSAAVELEIRAAQQRWVTANYIAKAGSWRVTLTTIAINAAAQVVFLVAGRQKAATLRAVLTGPPQPWRLPAQLIRPAGGGLIWMLDTAAARLLS